MNGVKYLVAAVGIVIIFPTMSTANSMNSFQSNLGNIGWYPNSPSELRQLLSELVTRHPVDVQTSRRRPIAVIIPHAGYVYSGAVMAKTMNSLAGYHYDKVIVIGPSHFTPCNHHAILLDVSTIATPLGHHPVDQASVQRLSQFPEFLMGPSIHQSEHSVQVEFPWIQSMLPNTPIVPIVLGQLAPDELYHFANRLRSIITGETLVMITSDFIHYGSAFGYTPFTEDISENIRRLDSAAVDAICTHNLPLFRRIIQTTGATICGEQPIQLLLTLLPYSSTILPVGYERSADRTSDWSHSVSYVGMSIYGQWAAPPFRSASDQYVKSQELLAWAKACVAAAVTHETPQGRPLSSPFSEPHGVFVTIKKNGNLRGCIGSLIGSDSIIDDIATQARHSALNDHRFEPITRDELPLLTVELTVLSPPKKCDSASKIRLGIDGIIFKKGLLQSVFLPQVPVEQSWDLAETLSELAIKAGLSADAWKDNSEFFTFQGMVIN